LFEQLTTAASAALTQYFTINPFREEQKGRFPLIESLKYNPDLSIAVLARFPLTMFAINTAYIEVTALSYRVRKIAVFVQQSLCNFKNSYGCNQCHLEREIYLEVMKPPHLPGRGHQ
jgi:hypothetical protein